MAGLSFPGAAYLIVSQGGKAMRTAGMLYIALLVGTFAAAEGGWIWFLAQLFLAE